MKKTVSRILIADNQPLIVAGLSSFLSNRDDLMITSQVYFQEDLMDTLHKDQPDLLITDYNSRGFITTEDLQHVCKMFPNVNVLILSSDDNRSTIRDVLQFGIKGYLTKDSSKEEILLAVLSTAKGDKFFSNKILDIIMEKHLPSTDDEPGNLTIREKEILILLARGGSTQKIADELYLSPHTVQTHRKSIIRKLKIKSPTEFVIYALDMGLIKPK